jgi:rhodanese-related sulfurtransferase
MGHLVFNMKNIMNKILLIVSVLFLFGCASDGEGYMQKNELMSQIEKGQAPIIIDVRSSSEYQAGHVPGAVHIPFWTAFTTDETDNYEKKDLVVMYCEHGPRAGIAKLALSLSGFENISYLDGHMTAWRKSGLPIEADQKKEE